MWWSTTLLTVVPLLGQNHVCGKKSLLLVLLVEDLLVGEGCEANTISNVELVLELDPAYCEHTNF